MEAMPSVKCLAKKTRTRHDCGELWPSKHWKRLDVCGYCFLLLTYDLQKMYEKTYITSWGTYTCSVKKTLLNI